MQPCNRATVQPCNRATNTGNKLNALLAVLALVAATLATPSAFAYRAVVIGNLASFPVPFDGMGNTKSEAISVALASCNSYSSVTCPEENEVTLTLSGSMDEPACLGFSQNSSNPIVFGYSNIDESDAQGIAQAACINEFGSCSGIHANAVGRDSGQLLNAGTGALFGVCDRIGLVCGVDGANNFPTADGEDCRPCPDNSTANSENTACTCNAAEGYLAEGDLSDGGSCELVDCGDNSTREGTTCTCNSSFFGDENGMNCECQENFAPLEGTCTRILECIGNQIRDPEMPTECMNCEDKTANEERNLCEAACTGDNEVKDGEGDCRTCESDSIPNEANTECLPNCSNHDEYKDTDGYCVQCNTGLVASDNNDSCVAVPAVKTPSSKTGVVLGLVVLGVYAANVFAAPAAAEVAAINWTPSYAFRNNNGNISYSVGSRWTARTDNWRYYWQTTQSGGKLSYGSGMNYNTGIFAATMDSESDSDMTDLDISLSATKAAGLWHFNGGYNLDARLSPTEKTEMQNRLNIAARYSLDKWILSATANTDGERAAARINYSYRF